MRAILTYHSIDPSGSPVSCHPDAFDRHLRWLQAGRVKVTTLDELVGEPDTSDAVAITFDDALVTIADVAVPRLLDLGLPSTVFVVTDHAGRTNAWHGRHARAVPELPVLSWASLGRLWAGGVAIGSHTRTHPDLTRVDPSRLDDEIRTSADTIERETGHRPAAFAYPYGRVNDRAAAAVAATYRVGCTTDLRCLDGMEDAARLPRLDAYYFQVPGTIESWGSPAFRRFVERRARLRRIRAAGRSLFEASGRGRGRR